MSNKIPHQRLPKGFVEKGSVRQDGKWICLLQGIMDKKVKLLSIKKGQLLNRANLNTILFLCMVLSLPLNSFAMSLQPQKDGNYTIIEDYGNKKSDVSTTYIVDNYKKYHSDYWTKVKIMLDASLKYRRNGGNFK